ncbi:MAG: MFS transporter [Deltaproteobacteria bacterium]|nr:MFS transporter [Deltaproteobacteria bacterium]
MSAKPHRASPDHDDKGWPKGIKYIIGNEGCERFSFYGMKAILFVYLAMLYRHTGLDDKLAADHATEIVHIFVAATYGFGLIGAVLAEKLLGKYRTILYLSLVYCAGHAALAIFEDSINGTYLGLGLIAIGSGGIKPCVSAHVGDQFGRSNWFRIQRVFQLFYFIINFGSFFSTLFIPIIKEEFGYSVAFGIPGILMGIATIFFWMGRHVFIHVPARPGGKLGLYDAIIGTVLAGSILMPLLTWDMLPALIWGPIALGCLVTGVLLFFHRQTIERSDGFLAVILTSLFERGRHSSGEGGKYRDHWFFGAAARKFGEKAVEGPAAVFRIVMIFVFVSLFWALFDQHASSWIRQAGMMDRDVVLPIFGEITLLPEQISALNPLMVMTLIPLVSFFLYPGIERLGIRMSPLRRMTIGMFIAAASFAVVALIQASIAEGAVITDGLHFAPYLAVLPEPQVSVLWQIAPYFIITLAEVMVSITGLEFAYTQAPTSMKSIIMGFWLLTVTLGNVLVATIVSKFPALSLTNFFWVFAALMGVAGLAFGVLSWLVYEYKDYTQE